MPRKIPDLDATILREAQALFQECGYKRLDMKQIAKACGTSVGNLYNYYRSKLDLFLSVSAGWVTWVQSEYQALVGKIADPAEALEAFLWHWMGIRKTHGGLWQELFTLTDELPEEEVAALKNRMREVSQLMIQYVDGFLDQMAVSSPRLAALKAESGQRLASTLLMTAKILSQRYESEEAANKAFLHHYLQLLTQ